MFDPKNQFQALQRRRGKGLDLTIILNGEEVGGMGGDDGDDENDEAEKMGLAPDILDSASPDNARPDVARSTQDGDQHAIDEELGDTNNAADDESMKMPSPDEMTAMLGKGRPNGLRARAASAYGKPPMKK